MATYREEQAARHQAELDKPFKHTHTYYPDAIDQLRGRSGASSIAPGSQVQTLREHTRHMNAGVPGWSRHFQMVRDEQGNVASVARSSMARRGSPEEAGIHAHMQRAQEQSHLTSPDAMRWTPEVAEHEMGQWQSIFHDRRGER